MAERVWIGGVELEDLQHGDASAVEADVASVKQSGGGWINLSVPGGGGYRVWISPDTDVVIRYTS